MSSSPYGSIGASRVLSDVTSVGAMLDVARSPSSFGSDRQEISAFITQKITREVNVQANVMQGLSNGSPDYGGGVMVTAYF